MKRILTIVLVVVVALAGVGYFIWESQSYVAKVGNQKIVNHEYIFFLRAQKIDTQRQAGVNTQQDIHALWVTPVDGDDPKTIVMNQALENAKEFKIQLIKAEQSNIKLSGKERKEILENLNASMQNKEIANYVKMIWASHCSVQGYDAETEIVNRLAHDFIENNHDAVTVTEQEAASYYQHNRDAIDEVTVSHLFISTEQEGLTDTQKQEKRQYANGLLEQLRQGEDITALIREYSEDALSKDSEGLYTFTYAQSNTQKYLWVFSDWAFSSEPGEFEMIESQYGYHIVKLENKTTFDDKEEQIKNTIKSRKLNELYYNQVQEWNKDPSLNLVKNEKVLFRITQKSFQ